MGIFYYIVNLSKSEYLSKGTKLGEMPSNNKLFEKLIELLQYKWRGDKIGIFSEDDLFEMDTINGITQPRFIGLTEIKIGDE